MTEQRKKPYHWTEAEESALRQAAAVRMPLAELMASGAIPGRSEQAISNKLLRMGLTRKSAVWTAADTALLEKGDFARLIARFTPMQIAAKMRNEGTRRRKAAQRQS